MTKTKKDNLFITFLQGFVIGFGIIFPISSSVLAMTMGIYERLLKVINNLFTSFKEEKGFLISFILGVVASAIVCCLILNITLNKFPVATLLFFVGLIVGGIQMIVKKTEKKITLPNVLCSIIGAAILLSLSFLGSGKDAIITTNLIGYLKVFGVGIFKDIQTLKTFFAKQAEKIVALEEKGLNEVDIEKVSNEEVPTVEDFKMAIEDICEENNIQRIVLFIDEAAHNFIQGRYIHRSDRDCLDGSRYWTVLQ